MRWGEDLQLANNGNEQLAALTHSSWRSRSQQIELGDIARNRAALNRMSFLLCQKTAMPLSWVTVLTWLVSLRTFSVAQDSALEEAWRGWKRTYGKEEEPSRRATRERNLQLIEQHNREADEEDQAYWRATNHFSDLTSEELNRTTDSSHPDSADPHHASQGFSQAPAVQQMPKHKKQRHARYGPSRKDQLALTYTRKLGKQHSGKFAKPCLISSNGTKKLLGRRCSCTSRYRRRCQRCCKLGL
ncbi:uncharacterized protein LOC134487541 [Candoia aspera]|uniref:uncharacterized protein LOC134487541 n=1 Tax=Candoia aspera TaxID=51853 RepID=UPI002FD83169